MLEIFGNSRLKKDASDVKTGFLPLGGIRSAVVVVDATADKVDECVGQVEMFCKANKIALRLMYIDLRKYNSKTTTPTDIGKTLLKRDLNWYGRPNPLKVAQILSSPADLYICLHVGKEYCVRYLSSSVRAKFKVGPSEYKDDPFNIVVSPMQDEGAVEAVPVNVEALFLKIRDLLVSVR